MESQPQNPEFRINPKNFHPCEYIMGKHMKFGTYPISEQIRQKKTVLLSTVFYEYQKKTIFTYRNT